MKVFKGMLFCLLLLTSPTVGMAKDLTSGKTDFERYCASCHGVTGVGNGPISDNLRQRPADLTMLSKRAGGVFPEERVIKTIDGRRLRRVHGPSEMPVWGQWFAIQAMADGVLQEDLVGIETGIGLRLKNLVAFIKSIQN